MTHETVLKPSEISLRKGLLYYINAQKVLWYLLIMMLNSPLLASPLCRMTRGLCSPCGTYAT